MFRTSPMHASMAWGGDTYISCERRPDKAGGIPWMLVLASNSKSSGAQYSGVVYVRGSASAKGRHH